MTRRHFTHWIKNLDRDNNMNDHEKFMTRALELAAKGAGHTKLNPMVGCVVVKDGRIVAEGYHEKYGEFHAERNALTRCSEDVTGADMYVTLEPCCHHGKTPPCTDIIIERGIGRVFVGSMDPNPLVAGGGVKVLKDAGIEVVTGILEEECLRLNEIFFHYITHKTPYVALKYAMTLDGKIACYTGDSKWVTSDRARDHVHGLRRLYSSILVGIGTVLADDPTLTCRIDEGVDPTRIICDSTLRIPLDCNIVKTAKDVETIIFTSEKIGNESFIAEKVKALEDAGIEVIFQPAADSSDRAYSRAHIDLGFLKETLAKKEINSILVEGGTSIHGAFVDGGYADKVYAYIAPKIVGGATANSPVGGIGIPVMADALKLKDVRTEMLGTDVLIEGRLR